MEGIYTSKHGQHFAQVGGGSMRQIRFRWLALPGDEWMYGDFRTDTQGTIAIAEVHGTVLKVKMVRPETVGQFTGFYDLDGQEIYEGDLLRLSNNVAGQYDDNKPIPVEFFHGAFGVRWKGGKIPIESFLGNYYGICDNEDMIPFRVVGNIYENPELIPNRWVSEG
jgi:uncharacterized phage protein (TIGR01671 family)